MMPTLVQALSTDAQVPNPIVVTIDAQVIGALYASRTSPYEFNQFLMQELKSAGAPIEGTLRLRPSHGKVGRVKTSIEKGHFAYFWISDEHWALIQGGLKDDGWKDWVQ